MWHVWGRGKMLLVWWKSLGVKRPLGRPKRRLEDNIEMDIKYIGFRCVGWVDPVQDRGKRASFRKHEMDIMFP
jgi:hypothetical protein